MKKQLLITLALFALVYTIHAQPGTIDTTFNTTDVGFGNGDGANSDVRTTSIQSDGKIIIGGIFTYYNGISRNRIARMNADGTIDESFDPGTGTNDFVLTTAIQNDGKIIIGGQFITYNGIATNRIARLNTDGTLDISFNLGTGANGTVRSISILNDGKIIIGGDFTSYNGTAKSHIARLNTDGTLDSSFNLGTGANSSVQTTSVQSDGEIIIGGDFLSYNGVSRNRIAYLNADGTLNTAFNPGTGANNTVQTASIQSDGKIIIGGIFTTYNGTDINRIARLNPDGTIDGTFNTGIGTDDIVLNSAIQSDGKIIIAGRFTSYNGTVRKAIARLNTDGTVDNTFNTGTGLNAYVYDTAIQNNGQLIIGGSFSSYNGVRRSGIARANVDGSNDNSFNDGSGMNSAVYTTAIQSDGKIIVGGTFSSYNGTLINTIARLNVDGHLDGSFNSGTGANSSVLTTCIQNDGRIIIGGYFSSYNGTATSRIARLNVDGTLDSTFNLGSGANNSVITSSIQSDGQLIIGGNFTNYNGTAINRIARLNADGTLDSTFNTGAGASSYVRTTAIQSDGKIIIGGEFYYYNGTARNRIARLNADGTLDVTFNPGIGAGNIVYASSIQSDGKIIIGGQFTTYNGIARNRIARLNADGTLDVSFDPGTGVSSFVRNISIQSDGKIIIAGQFVSYNGTARRCLARLNVDGTLDDTFNPGTGTSNNNNVDSLYSTSIQADGKIIIGGDFTSYNGTGRNRIARINGGSLLAIPVFEKNTMIIYPNPVKDILNIQNANNIAIDKIEIIDMIGKIVMKQNGGEHIDVQNLQQGIYLIQVSSGGNVYREKFIKE